MTSSIAISLHPRFVSAIKQMFNLDEINLDKKEPISGKTYGEIVESLQKDWADVYLRKDIVENIPRPRNFPEPKKSLVKQNMPYDGPFRVIGISGSAGSGKSTVAGLLKEDHGFAVIPMADPLKRVVSVLFDLRDNSLLDDQAFKASTEPLSGKTYRYILQTIGTEWGRTFIDKDIWVKLNESQVIEAYNLGYTGTVIPDVRFDNEASHLKSLGGRLLHIERPGLEVDAGVKGHASETGINKSYIDTEIVNNKGVGDLKEQAMLAIFMRRSMSFGRRFEHFELG